jgi:hypothetical protein
VWAESRWIPSDDAWFEVRATLPGLLEALEVPSSPDVPEGPDHHDGVFSLVVDDSSTKARSLPTLYFGKARIFIDRQPAVAAAELAKTANTITRAGRTPTYLLQACEISGYPGLYGREFHNRSPFRMKLERLGMRFSSGPFLTFDEDGRFVCDGGEAFVPRFVVIPTTAGDNRDVTVMSGALLVLLLASRRLHRITPGELHRLAEVFGALPGIGTHLPDPLVEELERLVV